MLQIIIALVAALATWQIQEWRHGAKEATHAKQDYEQAQQRDREALAIVQQNAAVAIRRADNVILAQNAAAGREVALRRDVNNVRGALASLHDANASAMRDAAQSQAACLAHAATLGELLETSAARYGSVAEKADGHASDVKTLTEAWPE